MNKVKMLEKKVEEFDKKYPGKRNVENHPTYKLVGHPDGYEQECYCEGCNRE